MRNGSPSLPPHSRKRAPFPPIDHRPFALVIVFPSPPCGFTRFCCSVAMGKAKVQALFFILLLLLSGSPSTSAASPEKIISWFFSNALAALLKRLWSLTPATKTAIARSSMMKFESGYTVETVFDGSKLGIEPYAVEISPSGEILVMDSINSNIYRVSTPLSRYSRPKLVAGSAEGYAGHVDGRHREARMNHPKGITMDDRGNIYVADTMNNAIRKISDTGVTTIAGGGRWSLGGHIDGQSEDAKFSNDFDVIYVGSSCSLLVVDRGNQAIREIQLSFDDCAYHSETGFPSGIAVLLAACFFGYMLALLQRRVRAMFSSENDPVLPARTTATPAPYQKPRKPSVRPLLIPPEDGSYMQEQGIFNSLGELVSGAASSAAEIIGGMVPNFKRIPKGTNLHHHHHHQQQQRSTSPWPMQESFVIPDGEQPPPLDTRAPTPRKTYAFMANAPDKIHQLRQGRTYFKEWNSGEQQQQQQQQQSLKQHRQHSSGSRTFYEQSCETTREIVFGAVQESGSGGTVEIRPVNHGDPLYDQYQYGLRPRFGHMGCSNYYY